LLLAVVAAGCACEKVKAIRYDQQFAGTLRYQASGAAAMEAAFQGMNIRYSEVGRSTTDTPSLALGIIDLDSAIGVGFRLVINNVTNGPAEIDLDDARATLTAFSPLATPYSGVAGHLSVQSLSASCIAGTCALKARGTVTFSATGPEDQTLQVSNGTFTADDERHDTDECVEGAG
jgi:hypothetical protein